MMALELLFHNGDVQTVPPGYVLNPATDREVRTHNGMTILVGGGVETLPFTAGVYGEVDAVENSRYNTITVTLANGNAIQFLHASRIDVVDGQRVEPNTVLGLTGNAGLGANGQIHLHVQARDANGNWINPMMSLATGLTQIVPKHIAEISELQNILFLNVGS